MSNYAIFGTHGYDSLLGMRFCIDIAPTHNLECMAVYPSEPALQDSDVGIGYEARVGF